MSGLGHFAVGLAAKPSTPEVPLWLLLAASETNDLLYFVFSSVGLESKAGFTMDLAHGVTYGRQTVNPWSHGLLMSIVWAALAALLVYVFYRSRRGAGIVALVVFSHWMLDFLMHSNLPIFFDSTPTIGLGLENSGAGFILMTLIDLILLGSGILIYLRSRAPKFAPVPESRK